MQRPTTPPRASRVALLSTLVALAAAVGVGACDRGEAPAQPASNAATEAPAADEAPDSAGERAPGEAAAERPPEVEAAVGRAKRAAKTLGGKLKTQLVAKLQAGGAVEAVDFCAENAQRLTAEVSEETGVRVGRSALRVRNADNAGPPWVTAELEAWGDRKAAEVSPVVRVADADGGRRVRFAAPIPVEAPCLTCHGAPDVIPASVAERLDAHYPEDAARGYALGDIRGAVWAEAPVEAAAE